jgi:hypothetical protein
MRRFWISLTALIAAGSFASGLAAAQPARNVIIFIADGLRRGSVTAADAPALLRVRERGVDFVNSHSLFPTFTTANASGIATGHYLGDTGDFGNTIYTGFSVFADGKIKGAAAASPVPFLENDQVLADVDEHFAGGDYLNEETLLALARSHGFNTAAIGKLGPVGIQDVTQLNPVDGAIPARETIFIDDATGSPAGIPLSGRAQALLTAAGLPLTATRRNQPRGDVAAPGTLLANVAQQRYFLDAAVKAILPAFKEDARPFVLLYWSRDPDGSQHNQGDSLNSLTPGINGPTSRAGVSNADANLRELLDYLEANPALAANTDLFVTSDHGFATISKHEIDGDGHGSQAYATRFTYLGPENDPAKPAVKAGWLPPGFLAIDLAHALALPLYDPDSKIIVDGAARYKLVDPERPNSERSVQFPVEGSGLLGGSGIVGDGRDARVIVAANGGSDLIYLPDHDRARARAIVAFLSRQDYVGGLFVDSALGSVPGALPLSAIKLEGAALTPRPAIAVAFRTFPVDPSNPLQSAALISDSTLQEGQGMHGSIGRDNTFNNMAALGPDFKRGFVDAAPVGNADIAATIAHVLGLRLPSRGKLKGRVLQEALAESGWLVPKAAARVLRSAPSAGGRRTVLEKQTLDGREYFDAACFTDAPAAVACH